MSAGPQAPPDERLGRFRRMVLIVVGSAAAAVGVSVAVLLVILIVRTVTAGTLAGWAVLKFGLAVLFAMVVSGGFAAYGIDGVVRGVRGRSRARFAGLARAEAWCQRNWYFVGVGIFAVASGITLLATRDPAAFLVNYNDRLAWYGFLGFLALPVHVALHELGHAFAGALLGFRFESLRVGWVVVHRAEDRIRFAWSPPDVAGALGFHLGVPLDAEALRPRLALRAAAGPAMTLAAAAACRAGATFLGPPIAPGGAVASWALWTGWWVGVSLAVGNLVPFRLPNGLLSDGARVLEALLPSPAADIAHGVAVLHAQGRRPREWGGRDARRPRPYRINSGYVSGTRAS